MKANQSIAKTRKKALERCERTPSRVFRIEKRADGTLAGLFHGYG